MSLVTFLMANIKQFLDLRNDLPVIIEDIHVEYRLDLAQ